MKKNIILLGALIISGVAYSQVGIDTDTPKATLDIKASPTSTTKIDGLIAPRLKGSELKTNDTKYTSDQDGAIVYVTEALASANTSIKTANVTSIGYYYFDKTQGTNGRWMKIANPTTITYQEPWVVQGGTTPATTNSQAISQNASVAIGKSTAYNSTNQTMLDVAGAVRGGTGQAGVVGTNSAAFGNGAKATGTESFAIGNNTTASGAQSFAGGGNGAVASGVYAYSFGNAATAIGNHAVAMGVGTVAPARSSVSLGRFNINSFTSADITQNADGDPIFQLGVGADTNNRWNTITSFYLNNSPGWVAIGGSTVNTMPTRTTNNERLRVYGGALSNSSYVTDINSVTGAATDKIVVADATTGQLKTISSTGASVAYQEPWVVQGSTTPATTNSQAISQNASVAIGKSSAYSSTNTAMLDVAGAVRTGINQAGVVGVNSIALGDGNTSSNIASSAIGKNNTSSGLQSFAIGNGANATGNGSFAGGYYNSGGSTASGVSSFAFGASSTASGENSIAFAGGNSAGQNSLAIGPNAETPSTSANSFALGNSAKTLYNHSVAIGVGLIAPVRSSAVFGRWNAYGSAITGSDNSNNLKGDPIFQIGTGSSNGTRANLITAFTGMNWSDGSYDYGQVVINGTGVVTSGVVPSTPITPSGATYAANLSVYGNGGIATNSRVYASNFVANGTVLTVPDYVFQKYYTGTSSLKSDYHFTSNLYEIEKYLKENHHLPGVMSAKEISEAGSYDLGKMQFQNLEKTEELYLHSIEQQKQIDELKDIVKQQQKQIDQLLKK